MRRWLVGFLLLGAGCTDENVVFRDREQFQALPPGAANFVGYTDEAEKLVVCGNCHVGQQSEWEQTAHADAWATLQASGSAQPFCEECHTVNQRGNLTTAPGGWATVKDPRYHDVQCESCHGPGLSHIQNPDATQPLAPIKVDTALTTGCGECHNGTHHPFVEEWRRSAHAGVVTSAAGNPSCQGCHQGQGILRAWNVKAAYAEQNSTEHLAITCAICHDPHNAVNEGQLRFPVNTPQIEEHLCARCHNRRTEPDSGSAHGLEPHAPESALLVGDAGWFPPNSNIDRGQILGTHGSERNPRLCATCHVVAYPINDKVTGELITNTVGHLFAAIPCVDAQGVPVGGDCGLSTAARSFKGCTASGCHTEQSALSVLATATLRIRTLANRLEAQLRTVDPNLTGAGGEIDPANPQFTVAEGAFFNLELARFGGSDNADPLMQYAASTAHNPFLIEALLLGSINEVTREYGVSARPGLNLEPTLRNH
ncbi:MAG TPA: multiheme c-type cytochrome [Longimicrobiales bacterium]|nr:multiheme c-type cytochrome [Longimicrobiales bacterium]